MWLHVCSKLSSPLPSLIQVHMRMYLVIPKYSWEGDSGLPALKPVGVGDIGIRKLKLLIDHFRLLLHICTVTFNSSDLSV